MTTIMVSLSVWYILGLIGSVFAAWGDLNRGHDLTLGDAVRYLFISVAGLLVLVTGFQHWLDAAEFKSPVLIKGRYK